MKKTYRRLSANCFNTPSLLSGSFGFFSDHSPGITDGDKAVCGKYYVATPSPATEMLPPPTNAPGKDWGQGARDRAHMYLRYDAVSLTQDLGQCPHERLRQPATVQIQHYLNVEKKRRRRGGGKGGRKRFRYISRMLHQHQSGRLNIPRHSIKASMLHTSDRSPIATTVDDLDLAG